MRLVNYDDVNITFDDCAVNRREFGVKLTNLVKNSYNESVVVALNAEWGEGKTAFVKMWQNMLGENGNKIPNIYIDAFEHDHLDDAFFLLHLEFINI